MIRQVSRILPWLNKMFIPRLLMTSFSISLQLRVMCINRPGCLTGNKIFQENVKPPCLLYIEYNAFDRTADWDSSLHWGGGNPTRTCLANPPRIDRYYFWCQERCRKWGHLSASIFQLANMIWSNNASRLNLVAYIPSDLHRNSTAHTH